MRAVIMAGGSGTRLRPLTCSIPKPLAKLCGKPVIEYILELLAKNNIENAAITLMYKGEKIEEHLSAEYKGVRLDYSYEKKPLGTAGSVKNAVGGSYEDIIVISGDAMCDFNLTAAMEFHRERNADVTIITKQVADPREYGLVNITKDTVTGFCEKPSYSGCCSDDANTGVYIISPRTLELIPDGTASDFAKDIFPKMLSLNMTLCAYRESGYWCDIGDIGSYIGCHRDMLSSLVKTDDNAGSKIKSKLPKSVKITLPVYIGKNVRIGENTVIGSGTVLCDNVTIGDNCRINGSIIMDGACLCDRVTANSAVICDGVRMKNSSEIYEQAVVGENCVICENAVLSAGVKIWNNKTIPAGSTVKSDVKYGEKAKIDCSENGFRGATNIEITPITAAMIGMAAGTASGKLIAVASNGEVSSLSLKNAVLGGIASTGCNAADCGEMLYPNLIYQGKLSGADMLVYINSGLDTEITVANSGGLPLTRAQERQIDSCINRSDYAKAGWREFGTISQVNGSELFYKAMLMKLADFKSRYKLKSACNNVRVIEALQPVFDAISNDCGNPLTVSIGFDAQRAEFYGETEGYVPYESLIMAAFYEMLENGFDISVPFWFPRAAGEMASQFGRSAELFYSSATDSTDKKARETACAEPFLFDGLLLSVIVLRYVEKSGLSLKELCAKLPVYDVKYKNIHIGTPAPYVMKKLSECGKPLREGVSIENSKGRTLIGADKSGTNIRILAEAYSAELAGSLCDEAEELLNNILLDNT